MKISVSEIPIRSSSNNTTVHIGTQIKDKDEDRSVDNLDDDAGKGTVNDTTPSQPFLPETPTAPSSGSMTPMEEKEQAEGFSFSNEPLEVEKGIAVTEESVELHVADVVTQF